jgi:hypothetical protein
LLGTRNARIELELAVVHKVLRRFTLAGNASQGQYQAEIGGYLGHAASVLACLGIRESIAVLICQY